jgi:phosphoglycerol transferase MdoB-like AlkP superfamily enzyme
MERPASHPNHGGTTLAVDQNETARQHLIPWIDSARFLLVWLSPAAMGLHLKWCLMAEQGGFAREARSMGLQSLGLASRLSFFRGELLVGLLAIPLFLLISGRYMRTRWRAVLAGTASGTAIILLGIQLFALKEFGRFSTLAMARVGLGWGWHEPGSNLRYLASRETLLLMVSLAALGAALAWAIRHSGRTISKQARHGWKTAGELYLFALAAPLLFSLKSDVPKSPYQESSLVRSVVSLWRENSVDTGEFAGYAFERADGIATADLSHLSRKDLVTRYRQLTHAPTARQDARYFGKQKGANVLYFVLETTPETYLPVEDDMKQFPNLGRLKMNSFVGARHYTTFPLTRCALFSAFTSWYPPDDPQTVFGSREQDAAGDFIPRLASEGYETAVFSPLRASGIPDEALFGGLGFGHQYYPDSAITNYDRQPSWKEARVAADVATLRLLEKQMDLWTTQGHKFVAAFLPQVGHFPYPDSDAGNSPEELRKRGRAILAMEDAWLGELMKVLESHGQLSNTIILIFGDHGPRTIEENPDLRRGTIDEVAFHVPLLIYAPRAVDRSEEIPWLTSHIDLVPTVLDLLGEKGARESEQGSPIWTPALAERTTFFFARPMFGADGYTADGRFLMWHYFSDAVYENSVPVFDSNEIVPRQSKVTSDTRSNILGLVALEKAWHAKFAQK